MNFKIWPRRCRSAALAGQYRNIMNVCRVLPDGTAAKQAVDEAIDLCTPIGAIWQTIGLVSGPGDKTRV